MVPFISLIVSFLLFRMVGFLGLNDLNDWHTSLQWAVVTMLLLSASAHWGKRRSDLVSMVPPAFPQKEWIVTVTGILEIAGALGILVPALSLIASVCLVLLLIAMLPANIYAARNKMTIGGRPVPKLSARLGIQLVFITAILLASPLFAG